MGYRVLIMFALLALNGFFAAAEVSLVSVRRSRLRALAEQGQTAAQAALNLLANPERLLSVTQVGVTLASLGLGWAGEQTLYDIFVGLFHPLQTPRSAQLMHAVTFGLAFLTMSYLHVIIGEVVPKNLAIEKADRLAVLVAPALLVFYRISAPFVIVIERTASAVTRLLGLRGGHGGGGHSPEELKFIVSLSRTEGHLPKFEEDAIQALLELDEYSAREIMVPRNAIVSLPITATLDQALKVMREHKYSRVPVYEGNPEQITGYLHYKDLMRVWEERRYANERRRVPRPFRMQRLIRKPLMVPETKPLNDLADEFRRSHNHLALVVDEFGTIVGLVTLEDVLEQIFGEFGDEHDVKRPEPKSEAPVLELDASTTIRDLDNLYGLELPAEAGFETLAGFLLFQLGYIPKPGDQVEYGGRRFTIIGMERNRITRVRIEKLPAPAPAPASG